MRAGDHGIALKVVARRDIERFENTSPAIFGLGFAPRPSDGPTGCVEHATGCSDGSTGCAGAEPVTACVREATGCTSVTIRAGCMTGCPDGGTSCVGQPSMCVGECTA